MHSFVRSSIAAVAISCLLQSVTAQGCFDTNVGFPLGAGDETVSAPQPLGFSFTWPDGSVSTDAVATSNGRVAPGSSSILSSFLVDGPTFASDSVAVAAIWADLDFSSPAAGDVEFFADPGGNYATFTFRDAVLFQGAAPFSSQVQLNSDGSILLRTDNRGEAVLNGGLFPVGTVSGVSAGSGTTDPGPTDFAALVGMGAFNTGSVPTVYDSTEFDLGTTEIGLFPNGGGGYIVVAGECTGFPVVEDLLGGCNLIPRPDPKVGLRFAPNGSGGYDSAVDASVVFDGFYGPSIGASVDSLTDVDIGFPFRMPGGTMTSQLAVDSNGRVLPASVSTLSTFSPTVADMEAAEQIAVVWADWVPGPPPNGRGSIHFRTDGIGRALVTWVGVQPFALTGPVATVGTFQLQLIGGSNEFTICFDRTNLVAADSNVLIGASDGVSGAVERDLLPGPTSTSTGAHWEFFDSSLPEIYDVQPSAPTGAVEVTLTALTPPVIGTSFDLEVGNLPATAAVGVVGLGFADISAPLSLLDPTNPCLLVSSLDLPLGIAIAGATAPLSLDLTGAGGLAGFGFVLQAVVADLGLTYTVPVTTSNALDVRLGN